jgi:catechol 2,3-dioxygenase-like lactoylglutathione lyase family enzyme
MPMDSIDALFDQYDRGRMTRRGLMRALAMLALPAKILGAEAATDSAPIVRGLGVNHVGLLVGDIERSYAFYHRLFGVKKGWPAKSDGSGVHLDFPTGYISVDSVAGQKSAITHFSISIEHTDQKSAKQLADKINEELPDAKAKAAFQANDGVSTVNLVDPDGFHVQISPLRGR